MQPIVIPTEPVRRSGMSVERGVRRCGCPWDGGEEGTQAGGSGVTQGSWVTLPGALVTVHNGGRAVADAPPKVMSRLSSCLYLGACRAVSVRPTLAGGSGDVCSGGAARGVFACVSHPRDSRYTVSSVSWSTAAWRAVAGRAVGAQLTVLGVRDGGGRERGGAHAPWLATVCRRGGGQVRARRRRAKGGPATGAKRGDVSWQRCVCSTLCYMQAALASATIAGRWCCGDALSSERG